MYKQIAWLAVETYSGGKRCAGLEVRNTDMTKSLFPKLKIDSLFFWHCFSQALLWPMCLTSYVARSEDGIPKPMGCEGKREAKQK